MKCFITVVFFFLIISTSFCQSFKYDGFLLGEQDTRLTNYPLPMNIKSTGNGEYVISANSPDGGLKINDTLKFDQYNEWEELYRYKGVSKTTFKGTPESGGKIELIYYSTYTSKKNMSDFANGLNINIYTVNEDFEINIETKLVRNYPSHPILNSVEYRYSTIVPYVNLRMKQKENNESILNSSNDSNNNAYSLDNRRILLIPKPNYPGEDEGTVVVKITVDRNGNVKEAYPGARGTTIMEQKFWEEAKSSALKAKFNADNSAEELQEGFITYEFILD